MEGLIWIGNWLILYTPEEFEMPHGLIYYKH